MTRLWDGVIVGAGAAGMATAIVAAERAPGARLLLIDAARRPGAKILVSGGGRCNVTHERVFPRDYNGDRRKIARVLRAFDAEATAAWFGDLGVELKGEPTGKLFPRDDRAATVLEALRRRLDRLSVSTCTGSKVQQIRRRPEGFAVVTTAATERARFVVLATGGRSLPKSGSDGSGYELARSLGHSVGPTWPALVPLRLAPTFPHKALKGVSLPARLILEGQGIDRLRIEGQLLFTHFGVSGPVVLDMSRHVLDPAHGADRPRLLMDAWSPLGRGPLREELQRAARRWPRRRVLRVLSSFLPRAFAAVCLERAGLGADTQMAALRRDETKRLILQLTALPLPVVGHRGWQYAEVTAGGVPLDEVDLRSMASRVQRGLFLAGEILDCDGRIGGFNFQWAWSTGFLAGQALARALAPVGQSRSART